MSARDARQMADEQKAMDVTSVLTRLDAIVDRLEGVYERLIPMIETAKKNGGTDARD